MNLSRIRVVLIAGLFVLFAMSTAQAGPLIAIYGQTLCIDGTGNGTDWDWELRPEGGGTPFCSGTGSVVGDADAIVAATVAVIDGCAPDITAEASTSLGPCPAGMSGVTILRGPDSLNWELALEDNTNPPNLKVPTPFDPVFFNPGCRPSTGTPTPVPVPEPGTFASLLCGASLLFGLDRRRKR